jgi:DNA invertase Pin-like site-specific DNA recombinase
MKVKYVRWSSLGQSGSRQTLDSNKYDLVIQEQCSGTISFAKRPKAGELLKMIQTGKVTDLTVEEFSRLGRNSFDTILTLNVCQENDVTVHILDMNISSKVHGKPNPVFKMFSHIVSVIAEQQRESLLEITAMGRLAARQRGIIFGRRPGTNERKADFLRKETSKKILKYLGIGDYSIREIAKLTDSSTATVQKVKRIATETKAL